MAVTQWATVEQITEATGKTVDTATRSLAARVIEGVTGLIEEVERTDISGRDRYWLKLAVSFQAAWLIEQPDFLERNMVSAASQDGQSATGANPDWLVLAPMARRYLRKLSWRGTRTVSTQGTRPVIANVNDDDYEDAMTGWKTV